MMEAKEQSSPKSFREAIARSKLSLDLIAVNAGCSKRSIENWRNGNRPSDQYIGILSDILKVDLWSLYENQNLSTQTPKQSSFDTTILFEDEAIPSRIDNGIKLLVQRQMGMLWDSFHEIEEKESIQSLKFALSSHITLLNSLSTSVHSDADSQWLLSSLSDVAILDGRIYRDQLNHEKAIQQHTKALNLAMRSGSDTQIVAAIFRLAETLKDAGLIYDALSHLRNGLNRVEQANPRVAGELLGLGSEIYITLGEERKSEELVEHAAQLSIGAAKLPTAGGINFSETAVASYQMFVAPKLGNINKALEHIERGKQRLKTEFAEQRNVRWESHLYIQQSRVYNQAGDIDAACAALDQVAQLAHSISSRMAFLRVQDAINELSARQSPAFRQLQQKMLYLVSRG